MTTETKRDLAADLAICEAATPGPWRRLAKYECAVVNTDTFAEVISARGDDAVYVDIEPEDERFILESREGWPHAIRRAIAAEAEVGRQKQSYRKLRALHDEQCARASEYYAEMKTLRDHVMTVYQKARNDCARWDGGQCVGLPVFQDRAFARRLVRDLEPILFPEVPADAAS